MKKVPQFLCDAANIYEERNKLYGDNYKRFGQVMMHLFPSGVSLRTIEDHNRFGVFVQMVSKLTRYAEQFAKGGHSDSLDDLSVYSMMLRELDDEEGQPELDLSPGATNVVDGAAEVDRMRGKPPRKATYQDWNEVA